MLTDDDLAHWEDTAAQAGDPATMLIAGIARGVPHYGLREMTPQEIEQTWPAVTDCSSGDEIYALVRDPRRARQIAESWGSPWPDDD